MLRQAINNLLDNALDFTPQAGVINLGTEIEGEYLVVAITNQGEALPDFAFARLTERFFSLPRPATGKKSTGLGLIFVQEVMDLHGGVLRLRNVEQGVEASLKILAIPASIK